MVSHTHCSTDVNPGLPSCVLSRLVVAHYRYLLGIEFESQRSVNIAVTGFELSILGTGRSMRLPDVGRGLFARPYRGTGGGHDDHRMGYVRGTCHQRSIRVEARL